MISEPTPPEANAIGAGDKPVAAVWVRQALTHSAFVVGTFVAATYAFIRRSEKALLNNFGLDAATFAEPTTDAIIDGIPVIFGAVVIFPLAYLVLRRPLRGITTATENSRISKRVERWIFSDPASQRYKAFSLVGALAAFGAIWAIYWSAEVTGSWRASSIQWIVSANRCSDGCFQYVVEGQKQPIIGYPVRSSSELIAVVTARDHISVVKLDKLEAVKRYESRSPSPAAASPWHIRAAWMILNIFNGNIHNPLH